MYTSSFLCPYGSFFTHSLPTAYNEELSFTLVRFNCLPYITIRSVELQGIKRSTTAAIYVCVHAHLKYESSSGNTAVRGKRKFAKNGCLKQQLYDMLQCLISKEKYCDHSYSFRTMEIFRIKMVKINKIPFLVCLFYYDFLGQLTLTISSTVPLISFPHFTCFTRNTVYLSWRRIL